MALPQAPGMGPMGLGLGDMLGTQVKDETDEERKKRLLEQQRRAGPVSSVYGSGMTRAGAISSVYGGAY